MSRKLHVLFLSSWYPHEENPYHGIFVQRHAEAAATKHIVSSIFVAGKDDIQQTDVSFEERNAVYTYQSRYPKVASKFPLVSGWKKMKGHLKAFQHALDLAIERNGKPDIIHLNIAYPAGVQALHVLKKWNIPLILTEHWSGYLPQDGNYKGAFLKQLTQKVVEKTSRILVVSKPMEQAMKKHGLDGEYRLIANAVDTSLFHFKGEPMGPIRLLHVSTLTDREKNISGLLKAFAQAVVNHPDIKLDLVGDSEEVPHFKQMLQPLGLSSEHVNFLGKLSPADVAKKMQNSHFLVLSSLFEGQPCVILEAHCCGTPVLATQVGGIPDLVTPSNGIAVKPGDHDSLVGGIRKMIRRINEFDRPSIAANATAQYSYEAVVKELEQHYLEVIDAHAAGR